MIIEYDNEDRCIRVNGEYVAIGKRRASWTI